MTTFHWDFFGPRAEGTAAHFKIHLDQFLATNGIQGCETGTESAGHGHRAAFCRLPGGTEIPPERGDEEGPAALIQRLLKPKRVSSGDGDGAG